MSVKRGNERAEGPTPQLTPEARERPGTPDGTVGFGFKVADARGKLAESALPPRANPILIALSVFALVFTVALVSENFLHDIARHAFQETIRGNLKRLARASATLVDPDLHRTFTSPDQETSPEYVAAVDRLRRFRESDQEIAYIYTCVLKQGKVYFVLDPTEAGDADRDGVDDKSHIMEEYPEATAELRQALTEGIATCDIRPYRDRWGTFISGYAPIRDAQGGMVGIVGVDLSGEHYSNRMANLNDAYDYGIVVALMLAILSGLTAGTMQYRSISLHRQTEKREEKYREQIAVTLERLENALKIAELSRNRFSDLFEGIPVACLTIDNDGSVFEWNSLALSTFNVEAHEVMERSLAEVLGTSLYGDAQQALVKGVLAGEFFENSTWSEGTRTFLFSGHPLFGPDGQVTGGILAAVDITRQKNAEDRVQQQLKALHDAHTELNAANDRLRQANLQLEEMATSDMLTGLPNRRAFYEALEVAIQEAKRGRRLTLVQADIDYFKTVNDTFGHHAGDVVLQKFAAGLKKAVRPQDLVARHGGEEFFIILRGVSPAQALRIVGRMREEIGRIETAYGQITASFGVSHWHEGIESDEELMMLSDQALYEAKRQGRDRVVVADEDLKAA